MYRVVTARHHIQIRTRKQARWHPLLPPDLRPQDTRDINIEEGVWRIPEALWRQRSSGVNAPKSPRLATSERSRQRFFSRSFSERTSREHRSVGRKTYPHHPGN